MTGFAPRRVSLCAAWLSLALISIGAPGARAVELVEGRVELHGHVETQMRAISEKFSQELDLAQWYNVLELEVDAHLLPDGWGPIDLLDAHVRAEGRYDAIYSEGFRLFPSINTYGNHARRLPKRLRDAKDQDLAGVTPGPEGSAARIPDEKPAPFAPGGERRGIPDYDIFFRQAGGDDVHGTADDPARYANARILDYRYALAETRGPSGPGGTRVLGPWLPKNILVASALGLDRANPLRGRIPATAIPSGWTGSAGGAYDDPAAVRFYAGDPQLAGFSAAQLAGFSIDVLDPSRAIATALFAPDTVISELSRGKCERAGVANCTVGTTFGDPDGGAGTYTVRALNDFPPTPLAGAGDFSLGTNLFGALVPAFGGDWSGVVPCVDPTDPGLAARQRGEAGPLLLEENAGCLPGSFETVTESGVTQFGRRVTSPQNLRLIGGRGEAPFRPAPDRGHAAFGNAALLDAQGLYLPSVGLRETLRSGDLDPLMFNFSETERAWNRGASQQRTKELKEAYLDLETFDHRLWMRLGLQTIVWGKTEVFRTTDQWNPQDLALSSLPTLEESRIALWSARAVYSLYDVGPLKDVRLEVAANLDRFEPADLGACGEPYAADTVCTLTSAIATHSYLGVGIAGVDRPESPWKDPADLEIGGRIEWRWDRFSFALSDFYGHSDLPFADAIFFYDRSVDPLTGRPVVARLPGQALGTCARGGQIAPDPVNKPSATAPGIAYSTAFASHPYSVTTAQKPYALAGSGTDALPGGGPPLDGTTAIRGGIGSDPDCLRPGGAPGFANAFTLDSAAQVAASNALQFQSSNQQLFAWTCLATVGIAAALEPGACAWTFFTSGDNLRSVNVPVGEAFVSVFAGDPDGPTLRRYMQTVHNFQKDTARNGPLIAFPLASINRLANDPQAPFDRNDNGAIDNGPGCADEDPSTPCDLGGFDGFDTRTVRAQFPGTPTLDSSLTNEQRALLGCGPFFGVRCDSAARETHTLQFPQSGPFGGLDFMNMEASVLVQSWLGVEGTLPGQTTSDNLPQPGTIGPLGAAQAAGAGAALRANVPFLGGPACTRFVANQGLVKLPGCRGIEALSVLYSDPNGIPGDADDAPTRVSVAFEAGYLPSIDGCILGDVIRQSGGAPSVPVTAVGASAELVRELALCSGATTRRAVPETLIAGFDANQNPIQVANPDCVTPRGGTITENGAPRRVFICRSQQVTLADLPLIHPTAGCIDSPTNPRGVPSCFEWANRDLVAELFAGTAQLFQNELAAFSHNFLAFLAITSCDLRSKDLDGNDHQADGALAADPECFLPTAPYQPGRCSLSAPQLCANVKSFLAAVGVTRNTVRAAGNERFGRRTFIWHSGGEVVLRYDRHNVLGGAIDFAEDRTQTSWGVELTWVDGVPYADADVPDGITDTDELNFAVSVDRPTFVRLLNANRAVLFNTQWFVSYLTGYREGFAANGPVNVFFTFAVSTGYYQDRLIPELLTVYEFESRSGGVLPSLQYRFTDSLSVTVGVLYFFGRTELSDMAVLEVSPVINRTGRHAYRQPVENGFSGIRKRDEVFVKLRWTF